jgi:hypothetical protein
VNPGATSLDGHALAARYEALRQDLVESGGRRHTVRGLALLMRKGMAAWMKSVGEAPVRDAAIPAASSAMRMPEGIERNLIDIVASMALATALEAVT